MDNPFSLKRKDSQGRTICPNCQKAYIPKLDKRDPNIPIQRQFPNATPIEREQVITGICSDKCWKQFLGPSPDDRSHDCHGPLKHFIKKDGTSKGFSYDQAVNWR